VTYSAFHHLLLGIPALLIGAGTWLLVQRWRFFRAALSVDGVTLSPDVSPSRGADDGDSYQIRFEYEVGGVRYVCTDRSGTATRWGARAGRKVVVYYLVASPEQGRLSERAVAIWAVLMVVVGTALGGMLTFIAARDGGL
jgi:hypothetical protein